MANVCAALKALIVAARPFLSPGVVDETSGTIPLMKDLEQAIIEAEKAVIDAAIDIYREDKKLWH